MPDTLVLYNTLSKGPEPFNPKDPSKVTFYTCGPTVYDDAHIGNFRAFLGADLLRRFIESPLCRVSGSDGTPHHGPRSVLHVMNITDVGHMTDDSAADGGGEDKMAVAGQRLVEAKKSGKIPEDVSIDPGDPRAIAAYFTARFREDARKLGLLVAIEAEKDKSLMPLASANVDGMREVIAKLLGSGAAYTAGEPGARAIYFDVHAFEDYGALSGNTLEQLKGGAGGRVSAANQSSKRNPADFMLWKEDESHLMKWPSPEHPLCERWAMGYPGWHIECTAMSLDRLVRGGLRRVLAQAGAGEPQGFEIDLHSGGEDNIFPHHECERAQSCALTGEARFARHWFHTRYLMVEGKKMSKSAGTFFTARDLFTQGHEPAAVRLELIKTHYRSNADFSLQGLKDSAKMVGKIRQFIEACPEGDAETVNIAEHPACLAFSEQMHDDLNIAGALGALNKWMNETKSPTALDREALRLIDGVLGLLDLERAEPRETAIGVFVGGVEPSDEVEALLSERAEARKTKDFARADEIRDELARMGLSIKDAAGGKVEVSRV